MNIREAFNAAVERFKAAARALEDLPQDATAEQATAADDEFRAAKEAHEAAKRDLDKLEKREQREKEIREARDLSPVEIPDTPAQPRNARIGEEVVYRADLPASFFADQLAASHGDTSARERLDRNQKHVLAVASQKQQRDLTSQSAAGGAFLPPIYLADMYVDVARGGRPFADALPSVPLPDLGLSITLPSMDTGTAVAEQVDTGSVQETDAATSTISHSVYFIAGQQDLWRGVLERSQPGLDMIVMADLIAAYDEKLDTRLLSGTGTAMHTGIRAVSGINTSAYTDGSPTGAELLPKLYDAVQQINSAFVGPANMLVLHPRRAAWLAASLSSTFPLFQQGSFNRGVGGQDRGMTVDPLGLEQIIDPNIGTTYGASTNEDEIYVLASRHLFLMEGVIQTRVFEEVGSGTAAIRLQAFAYSAFISKRRPKAITKVSGTGLVTPSF